jgi:hypothetical protein
MNSSAPAQINTWKEWNKEDKNKVGAIVTTIHNYSTVKKPKVLVQAFS